MQNRLLRKAHGAIRTLIYLSPRLNAVALNAFDELFYTWPSLDSVTVLRWRPAMQDIADVSNRPALEIDHYFDHGL